VDISSLWRKCCCQNWGVNDDDNEDDDNDSNRMSVLRSRVEKLRATGQLVVPSCVTSERAKIKYL